jgi:hypothetical protein
MAEVLLHPLPKPTQLYARHASRGSILLDPLYILYQLALPRQSFIILVSDLQQPNQLDEASVLDFGMNIYYHDDLFVTAAAQQQRGGSGGGSLMVAAVAWWRWQHGNGDGGSAATARR